MLGQLACDSYQTDCRSIDGAIFVVSGGECGFRLIGRTALFSVPISSVNGFYLSRLKAQRSQTNFFLWIFEQWHHPSTKCFSRSRTSFAPSNWAAHSIKSRMSMSTRDTSVSQGNMNLAAPPMNV